MRWNFRGVVPQKGLEITPPPASGGDRLTATDAGKTPVAPRAAAPAPVADDSGNPPVRPDVEPPLAEATDSR